MNTLRTIAIVGSAAGLAGAEGLSMADAQPALANAPMTHALTQDEQARYQKSGFDFNGQNVGLSIRPDFQAHAADNIWSRYGGDPLFPGGVHSETQLASQVLSPKGQTALRLMGLNGREVQAIDQGIRKGDEYLAHLPYGTLEKKMSYGVSGVIEENNARFEDPRYPNGFDAYRLDAKVVSHTQTQKKINGKSVEVDTTSTETIMMDWATVCANAGELGIKHKMTRKFHHPKVQKHPKHSKTAPVYVTKVAENDQGHDIATPTNTFVFEGQCKDGKSTIDTTVVYNHDPQQYLMTCNIGSVATIKELSPRSNEQWTLVSPNNPTQRIIVAAGNNNDVTYKDQEVAPATPTPPTPPTTPTPPPTTPPTTPPTFNMIGSTLSPNNHEYVDWGGIISYCFKVTNSNPGDTIQVTDSQSGGSITQPIYNGNPNCVNGWSADFTAGNANTTTGYVRFDATDVTEQQAGAPVGDYTTGQIDNNLTIGQPG